MLFDPKWEQQTKVEPSVADFIAWLEEQPAARSYNWCDIGGGCLISLYLAERRIHDPQANHYWQLAQVEGMEGVARGDGHPMGWNCGAALVRARSFVAARQCS